MTLSRKKLYAAGECFGDCATRRKLFGGVVCGGGDSSSSNDSNPVTTNIDRRIAVQGGVGTSGDGNSTTLIDNSNSSDAVIALAGMGRDVIKNSGGAVVDLAARQFEGNQQTWNTTVMQGSKLIDKLIDQSTIGLSLARDVSKQGVSLANSTIASFKPVEGQQTAVMKWGIGAAAVIAAAVLLKGKA